jgi:SpoVK/Ycf46/Vps4 family AAA+-type ATPase
MSKNGKFKLLKKTTLKDVDSKEELPESDLCFQDGGVIYQFKHEEEKDEEKAIKIEPGIFSLVEGNGGIYLEKIEFKQRELLASVNNTAKITSEANKFFSRLHVYDKLKRLKKRGVLLYSQPGLGKTSAIENVCLDLVKEDSGTVVLVWPTSKIDADQIIKLLTIQSEYTKECNRLILIIEDIGGGESHRHRSQSGVDSGLLNLLDGVGLVFKLPTFIIATTNHPESLLESLADRPGRFDLMLKLNPPSLQERIELMSFICKRELLQEEKDALSLKGVEEFSIAHLEEVAVRSELDDKTHAQVIKEIIDHKKLFQKDFEEKNKGISLMGYDD